MRLRVEGYDLIGRCGTTEERGSVVGKCYGVVWCGYQGRRVPWTGNDGVGGLGAR